MILKEQIEFLEDAKRSVTALRSTHIDSILSTLHALQDAEKGMPGTGVRTPK